MTEWLVTEQATSPCDDEAPSARSPHLSWVAAWLTVLLAVSIIVRVINPVGWLGADDASYQSAAEHVLHGQPIHCGVMLPRDRLAAWQSTEPVASLRRFRDGTVDARRTAVDDADGGKEVLLLLGGEVGLALRNGSDMTGAPR